MFKAMVGATIGLAAAGCTTNISSPFADRTSAEDREGQAGSQGGAADPQPDATDFPRTITLAAGALTLHEPQIEDHAGFTKATAKSAAVFLPKKGAPVFGTIRYRASMVVDSEHRLVTIYDREILEAQFPAFDDEERKTFEADLRAHVRVEPESMPLDVVLGYVVDDASNSVSIDIARDPPTIYYADTPTMLVLIDGEPIKVPLKGAEDLSLVVNTNWDLFYSDEAAAYSLLLGDTWLNASSLDGPWKVAAAPNGVASLPDDARWKRARDAIPGGDLPESDVPSIIIAQAPAELIVTDGPPRLEAIPGTQLAFVANTSSDIVFNGADQRFYLLTSGRWFQAGSLHGDWSSVDAAPESFQRFPEDHPRAGVRASVAGTPEATLAVVEAQVPKTAEVSRETAAPDVRYAGAPKFERIPGTDVLRASNTTFDVFKVGERYYLCHDAVWFASESPDGPWTVTDEIPVAIYDIPSDSPAHHVTYVRVYETTPDTVYVGYTPGYRYNYVSGGVVVYGSGYYWGSYYSPYYYAYNPYWYYYPYPATYGQASVYQTTTGAYAHGHYAYGPYGGYWEGARYNPNTGRYGGGAYAWDYDTGVYEGWSYNPRNDVSTQTRQAVEWSDGDSYETWGETVVRRDQDWVYAERYGTEDGFRREVQTSRGGQAVQAGSSDNRVTAAKTEDGEFYAGANGNVYRRNENGDWEYRSDGEWSSVDTQAARDQASSKAVEAGLDPASSDKLETIEGDGGLQDLGVRNSGTFQLDQVQLERDWAARTDGRARYESFKAGGAGGGGRGGERTRLRGRRGGR